MEGAMQTEERSAATASAREWVDVCALDDIVPGTGVAALIRGVQIAIVRPRPSDEVFALSNYDPFSKAYVMSRGIVGDKGGTIKIASPIFKQNFDLVTGVCLDDASVALPVYPVRVRAGRVELEVAGAGGES
jgi:nitrite reductase (NADH) small subunit